MTDLLTLATSLRGASALERGIALNVVAFLKNHCADQLSYMERQEHAPSGNEHRCYLNDDDRVGFLWRALKAWPTFADNGIPENRESRIIKHLGDIMKRIPQDFKKERIVYLTYAPYDGGALGRVDVCASFAARLAAHVTRTRATDMTRKQALALLDELLTVGKTEQERAALRKQKEILGDHCPLDDPDSVMWVWYNAKKREDPYACIEGDGNVLLQRLGKKPPERKDKQFSYFTEAHNAGTARVRLATVFDAALNPRWEPGGAYKPLCDAGNSPAPLAEAVHASVETSLLLKPLRLLEIQ